MGSHSLEKKIWYRFVKVIYIGAYLIGLAIVGLSAYSQKPVFTVDSENSKIVCSDNKRYFIEKADIYGYELQGEEFENIAKKSNKIHTNTFTLNIENLDNSVKEKALKICRSLVPELILESQGKDSFYRDTRTGIIYSKDKQWLFNQDLNSWVENTSSNQEIVKNSEKTKTSFLMYQSQLPYPKSIDGAFITIGSWVKVFKWSIIGFAILNIALEAMRRIFLYIVVGKVIDEKI